MRRKSNNELLTKSRTGGKYASDQTTPDFGIGAVNPDPGRVSIMTYFEQIKSPLWQKKRLEILQRDNFTCRSCDVGDSQLHVHHLRYIKNKMIWEYEDCFLITVCEDCHKQITLTNESIKNIFQSSITTTDHAMEYLELVKLIDQLDPPEINNIRKLIEAML